MSARSRTGRRHQRQQRLLLGQTCHSLSHRRWSGHAIAAVDALPSFSQRSLRTHLEGPQGRAAVPIAQQFLGLSGPGLQTVGVRCHRRPTVHPRPAEQRKRVRLFRSDLLRPGPNRTLTLRSEHPNESFNWPFSPVAHKDASSVKSSIATHHNVLPKRCSNRAASSLCGGSGCPVTAGPSWSCRCSVATNTMPKSTTHRTPTAIQLASGAARPSLAILAVPFPVPIPESPPRSVRWPEIRTP